MGNHIKYVWLVMLLGGILAATQMENPTPYQRGCGIAAIMYVAGFVSGVKWEWHIKDGVRKMYDAYMRGDK